ncbi:hypothetical protein LWI29_020718 [Acer saccharum]|uniref:Cystatin domain-containing protein n=1 Tax=Acer saccharum TaxID=4024 RepID=A0AA39W393_ACESA|nr:hypothetical protein LWI29_020718 [Acer saccharum]
MERERETGQQREEDEDVGGPKKKRGGVVHQNMAVVQQNMSEVHQKYDFIDPYDPFWDGSPYIAEPTDKPYFVEYANQLKTTEGFHVDLIPKSICCTGIVPEDVDSEGTIIAAKAAVEEFNRLKGALFKLSKILNANCLIISSLLYFLTLQCSDGRFYEAKIDLQFRNKGCELVMFRPAKYYPRPRHYYSKTNEVEGQSLLMSCRLRASAGNPLPCLLCPFHPEQLPTQTPFRFWRKTKPGGFPAFKTYPADLLVPVNPGACLSRSYPLHFDLPSALL